MDCYKSLCTQFYDIDKPTAPQKELDFYLRYARRARGPILEPMCGSGRFLVPIAQSGFDIDERAIGHGVRLFVHAALAALEAPQF